MFHPTIGQRAHQSLSNTATPKLGMIPPRIRVNAGLHIAEGHNRQATPLGYEAINKPAKPAQSEDQPLHIAKKQSLHSPMKKEKTTKDNPKQTMSTAQAHKATQSCS